MVNETPHQSTSKLLNSAQARLFTLALKQIKIGRLDVTFPDGSNHIFGDPRARDIADLRVNDFAALSRIFRAGSIGFAEAYMDGLIETDDLSKLLILLSRNLEAITTIIDRSTLGRLAHLLVHKLRPNSRRGAQKNIHAHYDLGNAFYESWLDPSMTYSSARFTSENMSLEQAQHAKYRSIANIAEIGADDHVLEIGCGWGGFAEFAGRDLGSRLTGITISPSQLEFAQHRMQRQKLEDRVSLRFQDYRDLNEQFDRIVSIEMFEAVGQSYWPGYFQTIFNALKPGGRAGLQIITIADNNFDKYSKGVDFIQRYIFPGGMLPSPSKLREQFKQANLHEYAYETFGLDYARTLALWKKTFLEQWPNLKKLGFDEKFKNMWSYYLSYCEAGFRSGAINVAQIGLAKE
jgi:cyclopropane-fatty-acyl-phospholipid synthase